MSLVFTGCSNFLGTDCSKLPVNFYGLSAMEYYYDHESQFLTDFHANRIKITKVKTKFDTNTSLTSYSGCEKYYKTVTGKFSLNSSDSTLSQLSINYASSSNFTVSINNLTSTYLYPHEFKNSVTINGNTYTDTKTFYLKKQLDKTNTYADTIKVVYGLNEGFLRIVLDSAKNIVYEKVL